MSGITQETKQAWQAMAETFIAQASDAGFFTVVILVARDYAFVGRSSAKPGFWPSMRALFDMYEKAEREGRCVLRVIPDGGQN